MDKLYAGLCGLLMLGCATAREQPIDIIKAKTLFDQAVVDYAKNSQLPITGTGVVEFTYQRKGVLLFMANFESSSEKYGTRIFACGKKRARNIKIGDEFTIIVEPLGEISYEGKPIQTYVGCKHNTLLKNQ